MRRSIALSALLLSGCTVSHGIDTLASACPPPEFGRPLWVRFFAGTGAWIGGIAGGVVSVAALPITYPISLLAENGQAEFLFFPAMGGAAVGHALLGGASDVVDYTFRRAWVGSDDPVTRYDYVPAEGPPLPAAGDATERR